MKEMDQTEYAYKNGYSKALEDVQERFGEVSKNAMLAAKLQGYSDDCRQGTMEGCGRCIYAVEEMIAKNAPNNGYTAGQESAARALEDVIRRSFEEDLKKYEDFVAGERYAVDKIVGLLGDMVKELRSEENGDTTH